MTRGNQKNNMISEKHQPKSLGKDINLEDTKLSKGRFRIHHKTTKKGLRTQHQELK